MSGSLAAMPADASGATDPNASAAADPSTPDTGETVEVTITMKGDGTYVVYAGDEPDTDDGPGMSADDGSALAGATGGPTSAGTMGTAGAGATSGQTCQSIGEALSAALAILKEGQASAGAPGSSDDQFNAGFSGGKSPPSQARNGATMMGGR